MLTPDELDAIDKARWQIAYPIIEQRARDVLSDGKARSTVRLVTDMLKDAGTPVRACRLYQALKAMSDKSLSGWWHEGPAKPGKRFGRSVRGKVWQKPGDSAGEVEYAS